MYYNGTGYLQGCFTPLTTVISVGDNILEIKCSDLHMNSKYLQHFNPCTIMAIFIYPVAFNVS